MSISVLDLVRAERSAFAATARGAGPDAPTLCGDWRVRDLLAHLVIRDRRPDAGPGIFVPGLSRWTDRVQARLAQRDLAEQVAVIESGPPPFVPAAYPPADRIELLEYVVHHEDVRRARPGWAPRPPEPARDRELWRILALAGRSAYLRAPVGVVLRRPDGTERVVHPGTRRVVLTGDVVDLTLHALGRDQVVLDAQGDPDDVAAVHALDRGI